MLNNLIKNLLSDSLKPLFLKSTLILLCIFIALTLIIIGNVALMLSFPHFIVYIFLINLIVAIIAIAIVCYKLKQAVDKKQHYDTFYLLSAVALEYFKSKKKA
jgi:hypothetical protein